MKLLIIIFISIFITYVVCQESNVEPDPTPNSSVSFNEQDTNFGLASIPGRCVIPVEVNDVLVRLGINMNSISLPNAITYIRDDGNLPNTLNTIDSNNPRFCRACVYDAVAAKAEDLANKIRNVNPGWFNNTIAERYNNLQPYNIQVRSFPFRYYGVTSFYIARTGLEFIIPMSDLDQVLKVALENGVDFIETRGRRITGNESKNYIKQCEKNIMDNTNNAMSEIYGTLGFDNNNITIYNVRNLKIQSSSLNYPKFKFSTFIPYHNFSLNNNFALSDWISRTSGLVFGESRVDYLLPKLNNMMLRDTSVTPATIHGYSNNVLVGNIVNVDLELEINSSKLPNATNEVMGELENFSNPNLLNNIRYNVQEIMSYGSERVKKLLDIIENKNSTLSTDEVPAIKRFRITKIEFEPEIEKDRRGNTILYEYELTFKFRLSLPVNLLSQILDKELTDLVSEIKIRDIRPEHKNIPEIINTSDRQALVNALNRATKLNQNDSRLNITSLYINNVIDAQNERTLLPSIPLIRPSVTNINGTFIVGTNRNLNIGSYVKLGLLLKNDNIPPQPNYQPYN